MAPWISRLSWLCLGAAVTAVATGCPVRGQIAREASTEVALDGSQALVHIPMSYRGYETTPARIGAAVLMQVSSPWVTVPSTHRADTHVNIVIDRDGVRTMRFDGVSGPLQVTSDGPVFRLGDQRFRWTGSRLVSLTESEAIAVDRKYSGPSQPPWSKHGIVFREPALVVTLDLSGARYHLEPRSTGNTKTLTLVTPSGERRLLWSLDEGYASVTRDEFRGRFH